MREEPMKPLTPDALGRPDRETYAQVAKLPVVVVLDNIRSGLNVGSVFRTCDAFTVREVVLCGYTARPPHAEILKTALGATESVAWRSFPTTLDALELLAAEGYTCVPVEQTTASRPLDEVDLPALMPLALIFGNELRGVDPAVLARCAFSIEIPQGGTKHSLNVATAAGIVLWECYRLERRRRSSG
jgi:tRNA G18 (ribose-2'-O)-methylase SpoU